MRTAEEIELEIAELEQEAYVVSGTELELELRCVVAVNVCRIRTSQGMNQREVLARLATTNSDGAARANAWKIEHGRTTMTLYRLGMIAAVLGVSWEELVARPTTAEGRAELAKMITKNAAQRGIVLTRISAS